MSEGPRESLFKDETVSKATIHWDPRTQDKLKAEAFQKGLQAIVSGKLKGEENTKEKIIEPILYDVLGFDRNENDAEGAVKYAGEGGSTGSVEYFFQIGNVTLPIEAKPWKTDLDKRVGKRKSPARQGWDYAGFSNSDWFIVTNGDEWRLYKHQLRRSATSPLDAYEVARLDDLIKLPERFKRFHFLFRREAFVPDAKGLCPLDRLREETEDWQESISESLYGLVVDCRARLFNRLRQDNGRLDDADLNEAVAKLLFRLLFILFAEDSPLLPTNFLRGTVLSQYERERKWGRAQSAYWYVRQYFDWLAGRQKNNFDIYPYNGSLFDTDPILDDDKLVVDDDTIMTVIRELATGGTFATSLNYSELNVNMLGHIYERFLGFVIEIKEGRIDKKAQQDSRQAQGSYYTREPMTAFLVTHAVDKFLERSANKKPWDIRCLDMACGSGHFLVEFVNHVADLSHQLDESRSQNEWRMYVTENCVFGVDQDPTAVMLARLNLWINSIVQNRPFALIEHSVREGNSLVCSTKPGFCLSKHLQQKAPKEHKRLRRLEKDLKDLRVIDYREPTLASKWKHADVRSKFEEIIELKKAQSSGFFDRLQSRFACLSDEIPADFAVYFSEVMEAGGFELVIGNPPWGSDLDRIEEYIEFKDDGFSLARGQYDSYELFMEQAYRLLRENGVFAYVIPDSIVLPEHEHTRAFVFENTDVTCIIRVGEGMFPDTFRACYLLGFVKCSPTNGNKILMANLVKEDRKALMPPKEDREQRRKTIAEIVRAKGYLKNQAAIRKTAHYQVEAAAATTDEPILKKIDRNMINWSELFDDGRGVELGKGGEVCQCPSCYKWTPLPFKKKTGEYKPKTCNHCGYEYELKKAAAQATIITSMRRTGRQWKWMIVGEDIHRYIATPSRKIDSTKDGINYKPPSFYRGPRLLFRKTGTGVYAAYDDSGAYTNQVVFTFRLKPGLKPPLNFYRLEYILGVLCSRLMLYRLLLRSGDLEWKSFPYMTQKLIKQLPVRCVDFKDKNQKKLHDSIADMVAVALRRGESPTDHEQYKIETLVMQLYGITKSECLRMFEVFGQAGNMQIIREMKIASPDMILESLSD